MKRIIIIIFALGVMCIGCGIFYAVNGQSFSYIQEKKIDKKLNAKEYAKYYKKIQLISNYFDMYLAEEYPIKKVEALDDQKKNLLLLNIICNYEKQQATITEVEKLSKDYFVNFKPIRKDMKGSTGDVLYYYKDNTYKQALLRQDEIYTFATKEIKSDAYETYWILKKKGYYLHSSFDGTTYTNTVYATFKDYKEHKNALATFNNSVMALTSGDYEKIMEQLKTVTYHFTRKGNNYYLDSIQS